MPCPNCPLIKILEIVRKCFLTVFRPLFTNIEGTKAKKVVLQSASAAKQPCEEQDTKDHEFVADSRNPS